MVKISDNIITINNISKKYTLSSTEVLIFNSIQASIKVYYYSSYEELKFELELRSNIINASKELNKRQLAFKTFRESKCNTEYWKRTDEGGFQLKKGVKPYTAINDIYTNTDLYGTECATAIIIIFYRAISLTYSEKLFNVTFDDIYLMNWKRLDNRLGVRTYDSNSKSIPSDCVYFKNPEVNPLKMEWQGENAIDLGNNMYYGHGIGITTAEEIIKELNTERKAGATKSAYLLDTITQLGFRQLFYIYYDGY